ALRPAPGEVALDLFCGAGLFAGVLAEAVGPGGAVIAVEGDRGAVRDARHNLRRTPWARVHHGDVAAVLAREAGPDAQAGAGLRAFDAFPMTHHLECVATLAPAASEQRGPRGTG